LNITRWLQKAFLAKLAPWFSLSGSGEGCRNAGTGSIFFGRGFKDKVLDKLNAVLQLTPTRFSSLFHPGVLEDDKKIIVALFIL
jgi:hypothetical protein